MKRIWGLIILIVLLVSGASAEKHTEAWVMCQPDSEVCVRAFPKRSAEEVGRVFPGQHIDLSGKKRGRWYHCYITCEAGEGWIRGDFLSFYEPMDYGQEGKTFLTTNGKLYARRSIGGNKRTTLKKGEAVQVFLMADEWSVTDKGYIMTRFLTEAADE